jgi:quercetin dioxygenase-like cupin family protein
MDQQRPVRRIVTGQNEHGHSRIVEDGILSGLTVAERPGFCATNVWATEGTPAPINGPDVVGSLKGIQPPRSGTVLRVVDFPPELKNTQERARALESVFGKLFKDADHKPAPGQHPGMHRTMTIDYAILLSGEMVAVMEQGEVIMRAGDVLIQRGTNHAWSNRSGRPARMAFILIDGKTSAT